MEIDTTQHPFPFGGTWNFAIPTPEGTGGTDGSYSGTIADTNTTPMDARLLSAALTGEGTGVDFEYEGEMPPEVALDPKGHPAYAFNRLSKPANTLVMPAIHSAAIPTNLVPPLGGATLIGPLLVGLEKPVQIVSLGASVNEILTGATFAAYDAGPAFQGTGLTSAPPPPAALAERDAD